MRYFKNIFEIINFRKKKKPFDIYSALAFVTKKNKTEEECLEAVQYDGKLLSFVSNKTYKMCLAAVRQNGEVIDRIEHPSKELCLEAVKQNPNSLYYIKRQDRDICLEALKKDRFIFKYGVNDEMKKKYGQTVEEFITNINLERENECFYNFIYGNCGVVL